MFTYFKKIVIGEKMREKLKLINILFSADKVTEQREKYMFWFVCLACSCLILTERIKFRFLKMCHIV